MDWCTSGGAAAAQKRRVLPFLTKIRDSKKDGSTDERTRAGKRFLALAVCSGDQHWACTIAAWIFGKLAAWEQKISLHAARSAG